MLPAGPHPRPARRHPRPETPAPCLKYCIFYASGVYPLGVEYVFDPAKAQAVVDNANDGYTAEEISDTIYEGLPIDRARRIIAFAKARTVDAGIA